MSASLLLAYVSAALVLQVGVAMAVAFWRRSRAATPQAAVPRLALPGPGAWDGWREFRVARREYEDRAQTLCSFHLEPVDGAPLPPFVPGQFLTLAVPISSDRTLTRCYSLSDGPHAENYRISVKRVLAPVGQPEVPAGACSNQLHDRLQIGDVISAKAPAGCSVPRKSRHSCARDSGGASARVGGHAATRRGAASRLARRSLGVCQPSA